MRGKTEATTPVLMKGNPMAAVLREVRPLELAPAVEKIELADDVFAARARTLHERAGTDWVVVWADREHFANVHYLANFDPRFEEAVLVLGAGGKGWLVVGNEGEMYSHIVRGGHEVVLCQTFSLMGQKRDRSPRLDEVLRGIGLAAGDSVSVVGWKYPEPDEVLDGQNFFVPAYLLTALGDVIAGGEVVDATHVLIDPVAGMRADNEAGNIAMFEWGASRASDAIARIVRATKPGLRELEVVSHMGYAGEPLSCHPMFATGPGNNALRSPGGRTIEQGDAVFTALGYWGGLSCRAGVVAEQADEFVERWVTPYYEAIIAWYETVRPGVTGGELHAIVSEKLAVGGMSPALNPGHLSATDEWVHTNVRPGDETAIASGMALQCDIIPAGVPETFQINCEDGIALADAKLRGEIATQYPEVWARIEARRAFMKDELGIAIDDSVLPLSNTPGYYAPAFLAPHRVMVNG